VLKKRLVGVVTVKDGLAVQSFGYDRYLPLGRPEILVENFDRWGADEILLQCIGRSHSALGPDLELLGRIGRLGLSTPLIYAGGISTVEHGTAAVQAAADRICIDAVLHDDIDAVAGLAEQLGAQALIASLPLSQEAGGLAWLDYRSGERRPLCPALLALLATGVISEALVIDWQHEGQAGGFDPSLLTDFPLAETPLIAFGGLSEVAQLRAVLQSPQVVAAAVGNFLSYREHAIQDLKRQLTGIALRPALHGRSPTN
jgi:imidazole glycerol-phosphate synthase subunit HisF